jgi:hypothetical protein
VYLPRKEGPIMYCQLSLLEDHLGYHVAQLQREAEHQRLVHLALGQRQPLRRRLANVLVSAAEWLDAQALPANATQTSTRAGAASS